MSAGFWSRIVVVPQQHSVQEPAYAPLYSPFGFSLDTARTARLVGAGTGLGFAPGLECANPFQSACNVGLAGCRRDSPRAVVFESRRALGVAPESRGVREFLAVGVSRRTAGGCA